MCERELENEQNCNILTPILLAITTFLSRSHGLLNQGIGASPLWVLVFSTTSNLQLIWSPNCLISNWLNFMCTELYNSSASTFFLCVSLFCTHSTCPRRRLWYPDVPRLDAPVIYTGAFPILTARPGPRSVYNKCIFVCSRYHLLTFLQKTYTAKQTYIYEWWITEVLEFPTTRVIDKNYVPFVNNGRYIFLFIVGNM